MDVVGQIVKYNAQTNGRDKLCRLFQYASKFGWWWLQEGGPQHRHLVEKLKILENNLSATRKVLRFGKSMDLLQGALRSMQLDNLVLKLTLTLSKVNQAAYLAVDHLIWAGKIGLAETNTKKWARVSARFWLVTITFNLVRNLYDLYVITLKYLALQRRRAKQRLSGGSSYGPREREGERVWKTCLAENKPVVIDVIKNVCDVTLPLSGLGYLNTSAGFQGIMGIISSIMGVVVVWDPTLKLVPA